MPQRTCKAIDCPLPSYAADRCESHYWAYIGGRGVCGFGDCPNRVNSHGLCGSHDRQRRAGVPLTPPSRIFGDDEARFWLKADKRGDDECWPWTGSLFEEGYGQFNANGEGCGAHRWAYERFVGPVPVGLELDHLCHTRERLTCKGGPTCPHRRCCNPRHLQPVPKKTNADRRVWRGKVTPEQVVALHARYLAGEPVTALALEADILPTSLYARFRRLAA